MSLVSQSYTHNIEERLEVTKAKISAKQILKSICTDTNLEKKKKMIMTHDCSDWFILTRRF